MQRGETFQAHVNPYGVGTRWHHVRAFNVTDKYHPPRTRGILFDRSPFDDTNQRPMDNRPNQPDFRDAYCSGIYHGDMLRKAQTMRRSLAAFEPGIFGPFFKEIRKPSFYVHQDLLQHLGMAFFQPEGIGLALEINQLARQRVIAQTFTRCCIVGLLAPYGPISEPAPTACPLRQRGLLVSRRIQAVFEATGDDHRIRSFWTVLTQSVPSEVLYTTI